jgi:hypothetical protein
MSDWDDLKGMAAPARRALANAGHETFKDLTKLTEAVLAEPHGMGTQDRHGSQGCVEGEGPLLQEVSRCVSTQWRPGA